MGFVLQPAARTRTIEAMEINFTDPKNVPQPRDKIRIETLAARPYPDGWRVRVNIDVTPFQERPNLEVHARTADGKPVAHLSIIETMHNKMEFTIHIRGVTNPNGEYTLSAELSYEYEEQKTVIHQAEAPFTIKV
jgi:hypothetical protein